MIKNIRKISILIIIIILTINIQVFAYFSAPVIVQPVRPFPSKITTMDGRTDEEEALRDMVGVYRLANNPVIISFSEEDYEKLKETYKNKQVWQKDRIYIKTIEHIRDKNNILIFDRNLNKGYEVTEEELKDFLSTLNYKLETEYKVDLVEVELADKTEIIDMMSLEITYNKKQELYLDITSKQYEEIKELLKTFKEEKQGLSELSKIEVNIDGNKEEISKKEFKQIVDKIGTKQAKKLYKEIGSASGERVFNLAFIIFIIVMVFLIIISG